MIKPSDIVNKVFSRSFMGYDMREVDAFFDDIIDQFEAYEAEKKELIAAMEQLLSELEAIERTGVVPAGKRRPPAFSAASPERPRIGGVRIQPKAEIKSPGEKRRSSVALEVETGVAAPPKRIVQQELKQAAAAEQAESAYEEESDVL